MAMSPKAKLLRLLLLFAAVGNWHVVEGSGRFHLQMVRYVNHDSRDSGGEFCDTFLGLGFLSPCDPVFDLSLDGFVDGGGGLVRYSTGSHEDSDTVNFGGIFGSIGNPVVVLITYSYPGYVKFKMEVRDHDFDAYDHIDTFSSTLYADSSSGRVTKELSHKGHKLQLAFWFTCSRHFYGKRCSTYCKPHNDAANGHYECNDKGEKVCLVGWISADSNCKRLHPCSTNVCQNGGTCSRVGEGYSCLCRTDYSGSRCEQYLHPCEHRSPCLNGATCELPAEAAGSSGAQPDCRCPPQFEGPFCQYDVDECRRERPCRHSGSCENTFGGFRCHCGGGFAGERCELDVDECEAGVANPCSNNATCLNVHGNFTCRCRRGWAGRFCDKDVDECRWEPCGSGGRCVNQNGSFECHCDAQFTGSLCELHKCNGTDCRNGGNCSVTAEGVAACRCPPGFNGTSCETDVDDCASAPCRNGAVCVDLRDAYECRCVDGYGGRNCESEVDDCQPDPCRNGGVCSDALRNFSCSCPRGFGGARCERRVDVDDCVGVVCENNGTCRDLQFAWECDCASGFNGSTCQPPPPPPPYEQQQQQNTSMRHVQLQDHDEAFHNPVYDNEGDKPFADASGDYVEPTAAAAAAAAADDDDNCSAYANSAPYEEAESGYGANSQA